MKGESEIVRLPSVLAFQVGRQYRAGPAPPVSTVVDLDGAADVSLSPWWTGDAPATYTLASVVSYAGGHATGGHYWTHVRRGRRWYTINNDTVSRTTLKRAVEDEHSLCYFYALG